MIQRSSLECRCDFAIIRREVLSAYPPYLRFTRRRKANWRGQFFKLLRHSYSGSNWAGLGEGEGTYPLQKKCWIFKILPKPAKSWKTLGYWPLQKMPWHTIMLFVCHPKILHKFSINPKRNWRQCLCSILGLQTNSIMVCYGIFCSHFGDRQVFRQVGWRVTGDWTSVSGLVKTAVS